jgi:hypothetical protein
MFLARKPRNVLKAISLLQHTFKPDLSDFSIKQDFLGKNFRLPTNPMRNYLIDSPTFSAILMGKTEEPDLFISLKLSPFAPLLS